MVGVAEIEKNDWNLNISRYVETADAAVKVDVAAAIAKLRELEGKRAVAETRMNGYLKELGFLSQSEGEAIPAQRHLGEDHAILAARHALYSRARALNPARWTGRTRNWSPIGPVTLNPERDSIVTTHSAPPDIQPLAA